MLPPLIKIGHIKKTFGYQGELSIHIEESFLDYIDDLKCIFLELDGCFIPFFVEYFSEKTDILLKIDQIHTLEEAQQYSGISIFAEKSDFPSEAIDFHYQKGNIEGFSVICDQQEIGTIEKIDLMPTQLLATVTNGNNSYLIPIVEDFIQKIDADRKKIYLTLPEGLLSL